MIELFFVRLLLDYFEVELYIFYCLLKRERGGKPVIVEDELLYLSVRLDDMPAETAEEFGMMLGLKVALWVAMPPACIPWLLGNCLSLSSIRLCASF